MDRDEALRAAENLLIQAEGQIRGARAILGGLRSAEDDEVEPGQPCPHKKTRDISGMSDDKIVLCLDCDRQYRVTDEGEWIEHEDV